MGIDQFPEMLLFQAYLGQIEKWCVVNGKNRGEQDTVLKLLCVLLNLSARPALS